jgi:hypothetical protein
VITDIEQACDRLIVLGKGHTLLDLTVAEALAHHRIVEGPRVEAEAVVGGDAIVGSFPAPAGEPLSLVRTAALAPAGTAEVGRAATLEEVVIGHLAAGRARAAETLSVTEGRAA